MRSGAACGGCSDWRRPAQSTGADHVQGSPACFGFGYLVEPFAAHGVWVEVREGPVATDATQELVAEMLAIVTRFAARRYGSRSQQFHQTVQAAAKGAEGLA